MKHKIKLKFETSMYIKNKKWTIFKQRMKNAFVNHVLSAQGK